MTAPRVTVLLPTTGEKGKVIGYAMSCVLNQTVADVELFIIGDGMGESTREVVRELAGCAILAFDQRTPFPSPRVSSDLVVAFP